MSGNQIIQNRITEKLQAFAPAFLQVENESSKHNVPAGSETHFKVTIVSAQFDGERLVARHRKINAVLSQELANPVHALSLHTFTPQEWADRQQPVNDSPQCLGGSQQ